MAQSSGAKKDCEDDPTIPDESLVYRRVPPLHIVPDDNAGGLRPSSAAFGNDRDGDPMSVVLGDELERLARDPASVLGGHPGFALAQFVARLPRQLSQRVCRTPQPEEPAHGSVAGDKPRRIMRALQRGAGWAIAPET